MPQNNKALRLSEIPTFLQIILFILTLGLFYWLKTRQEEAEKRTNIQNLLPAIQTALNEINKTQNLVFYFSNTQHIRIKTTHQHLLKAIPKGYEHCGLAPQETQSIATFLDTHKNLKNIREFYNQRFIKHETQEFRDFFSKLDKYPLSEEQMQAVICEEDNNLVIAGAGTGKTTTISAKIAYILEKNLARPEELLVISFTNTAVEEMFERTCSFIKDDELVRSITFRNFNSFGNMVLRHCSPRPKRIAFDGKDYRAKFFLQEAFDKLFLENSDFAQKAVNFVAFFARPHKDEFDFNSKDDRIKHEQSYHNRSLNGTHCKSMEEVLIANFLYLHKVDFEYETTYPLQPEDNNPDFGSYQPDFYLPKYKLYHEHYGIDENGQVPDYFGYRPPFRSATEQYQSGMAWKQTLHEKNGTKLIKTYSFQHKKGALLHALKQQLLAHGVALEKRAPEEMLEEIKEMEDYQEFMNLIYTFLGLMKSNNTTLDELKVKSGDKRFKVFLGVFEPLYQAYQQELTRTSSIDYSDMVNLATTMIGSGHFKKTYRYILVDEFQDMSLGRYELLKALKSANPEAKLYAVGDDWQSIFRFTGSDISIITQFEKHFGATAQNGVLQTYRFNQQILQATSNFVQQNPAQLRKSLSSPFTAEHPAFVSRAMNLFGNRAQRSLQKFDILRQILSRIASDHRSSSIFLIGRYHHNIPEDLRELQKAYPGLKLAYHTAHGCKGLTCEVSILLDLDSGLYGFPSQMADDPILDNLLREGDNYENSEERRLFYVALTRARHQVYLLYDVKKPSKFVKELMEDGQVQDGQEQIPLCPACGGIMMIRNAKRGSFYGCSNYPKCEQTLRLALDNKGVGRGNPY
ncbi:MAG: hypothetical protein EOO42_02785 [Flavobacteriales bacterium]|nr:MAG: hypothetical protein EOO42_02785 [Flavobacteriales bacterium]